MKLDPMILKAAADESAVKVAEALNTLSQTKVEVNASKAHTVSLEESLSSLDLSDDHSVISYSQLLNKSTGIAVLILPLESALRLVDILIQVPVGTTRVLTDFSRSAIKETLNILSNSYVNTLAKHAGIELGIGIPTMVRSSRLFDIISEQIKEELKADDETLLFELILTLSEYKIELKLYVLF